MADITDKDAVLKQNLEGIGCSETFIKDFMGNERPESSRQISMLKGYRVSLLQELHEIQRKIDNVDYMIFSIKKGGN